MIYLNNFDDVTSSFRRDVSGSTERIAMIELYEVFYREGENELSKYVLAESEADLQALIAEQGLEASAYFKRADNPESTFPPVVLVTRLDRQADGTWIES